MPPHSRFAATVRVPAGAHARRLLLLIALMTPALPTGPARAADQVIVLNEKTFKPDRLTIARGTRIVFRNDDAVAHSIVAPDGGDPFDLSLIKPGGDAARVFAKAGQITVTCDLHPRMILTLTVE